MKENVDVSIVVPNYNSSDLINEALESIVSTVGDVSFDVMVIDDASTDGGFEHVDEKYKKDPRFTFIANEKNVGYHAVNDVMAQSGTYLMTFDTDARMEPNTLARLFAFMEATPTAGAATANLHYPNGAVQNYYRRLLTPKHGFFTTVPGRFIDKYILGLREYKSYHYDDLDVGRVFEIEQTPVACLILRREAIDPFIIDPDFEHFGDVDLCKRIYKKGYKIYLVPDAKAVHIKSAAFNKKTNAWKETRYYDGQMIYYRKHYPGSVPLMTAVLWIDRVLRSFLERTVGRAPMR